MSVSTLVPVRQDRVWEVYQQVRDLIVRGKVAPGFRLTEADLTSRFGVSRTSVRAALQRLEQEGYITALREGRRSRLMVAPLTQDDARELFAMVAEIEGLAAERAATLPTRPRNALVYTLNELNDQYRRVASAVDGDGDELFELDTRFHRAYVEAAAGPRLWSLHDAIKPQIERYIRIYQTALHDAIQTSIVEHALIISEISAGKGQRAQAAVRTNWRNAAVRLQAVIGARGEAGNW